MDFFRIVSFFGGLGLFIFGMMLMGNALEKIAGNKLSAIIEKFTSNRIKGVLCGAAVAAIIQSSSVATVMVVGFVNAGVMKLTQAVGVILGANIGTTITAQLIGLNAISADSLVLQIFKPTTLAPIAIVIGICLYMLAKRVRSVELGEVLIGFGILFVGMQTMEAAVSVLADMPEFSQIFLMFSNPIIGVLIGAALTAIIQSSSASVGILQAFASTGLITFSTAVPIILGQNIGTCVTAILSSVGANKNARRTAFIHLYFNVIGTVIFMIAIYAIQAFVGFAFWDDTVNSQTIANFHSVFNITCTLIFIPFANLLVKLANMTIKSTDDEETVKTKFDDRLLYMPAAALSQVEDSIETMFSMAIKNISRAREAITDKNRDKVKKIVDDEDVIDKMEFEVSKYLVKITDQELSENESKTVSVYLKMVNDIERLGDHAVNLSEIAVDIMNEKITYSPAAQHELGIMFDAVEDILNLAYQSVKSESDKFTYAIQVEPLEEIIDMLTEALRLGHIQRLSDGICSVETGVSFLEIINNLERIADHCSNIAIGTMQQHDDFASTIDPHAFSVHLREEFGRDYDRYYDYFIAKYYNRLGQSPQQEQK
ncbi:MAG: Na/Pi cotransporter family protein [Clostridia bacterium]|nr:Na/Pi cotransporter family protein [Clostridia bacterium]